MSPALDTMHARSVVRQLSKTARFTSLDFYLPPTILGNPIVRIPIRGRAIQVISVIDFNHNTVPEINGTDTEHCHCTWSGEFHIDGASYIAGSGVLNPAGTIATFPAVATACHITTLVTLPAGNLTLGAFQLAGACQPSATAAVCNVLAGVQVLFPGGPAGAYTLNMPIFAGAVVPACPGDVSFDPAAAASLQYPYTAESIQANDCESTWNQPAAVGILQPHVGYIHLNRQEDHIPVVGFATSIVSQQLQTIPLPRAPMCIRVEQEFDEVIIEALVPMHVGDVCAGIIIVEHETEREIR